MKNLILNFLILLILSGCHKDFLEEPTSKSLVIPKTFQDFNALLQFSNDMNVGAFNSITSDGEFTFTEAYLNSTDNLNRNYYLWKADIYETTQFTPAWSSAFKQVLNANVVLEGAEKLIQDLTVEQGNTLKGSALFFRAMAYTELVLNFTPPYKPIESETQLGLPIRRNSNISELGKRSNLKETMEFIIEDLVNATLLLPNKTPIITQPNKCGAFALLARNYLAMQEYDKALNAAKEALKIQDELLDYNNVPIRNPFTFPDPLLVPNPEIIFYQFSNQSAITRNAAFQVRQEVLDLYSNDDLRKSRFFNTNRNFIGTYLGNVFPFSGLATDEVWLIAAESSIRLNKIEDALFYLNSLCKNRYDKSSFKNYVSENQFEVMMLVLMERRKELITRSRWFDLRRLNLHPELGVLLTRNYKGITYSITPNSSRYTFSIPQEEVNFSGIIQHNRKDND